MGELTQKIVRELFEYREDGNLIWKYHPKNKNLIGKVAGCVDNYSGYVRVSILGKSWRAHRIIFLYHNGYLPKFPMTVDHIKNKNDNRIENLREADQNQQQHNKGLTKSNTSGVKGVSWNKRNEKWEAQLKFEGKKLHVGYFIDIKEAETAIKKLREQLHGEFANHR
jgi:hypothetical protein